MGIQISNAPATPGLTFDRIFMMSLNIHQDHQDDEGAAPIFRVQIRYRLYGVDVDGKRHYSGLGVQTIRYDDYLAMAMGHAVEGDPHCLESFQHIQDGVAHLIAMQRGTTAAVV